MMGCRIQKSNWPSSAPCSSKTWSAPKQQKKVSFPLRQSLMPFIVTLGKSNTPTLTSNAYLSCSDTRNASISDACAVHCWNGKYLMCICEQYILLIADLHHCKYSFRLKINIILRRISCGCINTLQKRIAACSSVQVLQHRPLLRQRILLP